VGGGGSKGKSRGKKVPRERVCIAAVYGVCWGVCCVDEGKKEKEGCEWVAKSE